MRYIFEIKNLRKGKGPETIGGGLSPEAARGVANRVELPSDVVKPVVDETIEKKRPLKDETKELIDNGVTLSIPEVFLKDAELVKQLQRMGILENDRSITENTKVIEKYKKYIEVLNFIMDVERDDNQKIVDKKTVVDNYLFLSNTASEFIGHGKEMIQLMYVNAIYRDILNEGAVLTSKGVTGGYEIIGTDITRIKEYERVTQSHNARNIIDVAIISSMVGTDFILNQKELVGQKSLVEYILGKYGIKGTNGKPIQARLIGLQKTHVLKNISNLKDNSTSTQAIQELTFLENYLGKEGEDGNYQRKAYNRELFINLNKYKAFQEQRALIQAMPELQNTENIGDKDYIDVLTKVAKDNQGTAIGVALFAWLLGYKKVALGSALFAAFGPSLGQAAKDVQGHEEGKNMTDGDLELVEQEDIKFTLENTEYQKAYELLADLNNENREQQYDENNRALPYMDNNELFDIIDVITSNRIDLKVKEAGVAGKLRSKLLEEAGDFLVKPKEASKVFIKLLKSPSFEKDDHDKTFLDYLTLGDIDIMNKHYESVSFLGEEGFDIEMNNILKKKYKDATTPEDRKNVLEMRDKAYAELSAIQSTLKSMTTGFVQAFEGNNFGTRLATTISYFDSKGETEMVNLLGDYKNFVHLKDTLSKYTETLDAGQSSALTGLSAMGNFIGINNIESMSEAQLGALGRKVGTDLETLESLITANTTLLEKPGFAPLKREANELKGKLQNVLNGINEHLGITASMSYVDKFDRQPEILASDIRSGLEEMDEIITKLNGDPSYIDIIEIFEDEDTKDMFSNLASMNTDLASKNPIASPTASQSTIAIIQQRVKSDLGTYISKYNEIKTDLESKFQDYYDENKTQRDGLQTIDLAAISTPDQLSAAIDKLKEAKSFLDEKVNPTNATGSLAGIMQQLTQSMSTANVNTSEILEKLDETSGKAVSVSKDIFPSLSVTAITLVEVEEKLDEKTNQLAAKVEADINNIIVSTMATSDILEKVDDIQAIREVFKDIDSVEGTISAKLTELKEKFEQEATINDINNLQSKLRLDIREVEDAAGPSITMNQLKQELTNIDSDPTTKISQISVHFDAAISTANSTANITSVRGLTSEKNLIEGLKSSSKSLGLIKETMNKFQ